MYWASPPIGLAEVSPSPTPALDNLSCTIHGFFSTFVGPGLGISITISLLVALLIARGHFVFFAALGMLAWTFYSAYDFLHTCSFL